MGLGQFVDEDDVRQSGERTGLLLDGSYDLPTALLALRFDFTGG